MVPLIRSSMLCLGLHFFHLSDGKPVASGACHKIMLELPLPRPSAVFSFFVPSGHQGALVSFCGMAGGRADAPSAPPPSPPRPTFLSPPPLLLLQQAAVALAASGERRKGKAATETTNKGHCCIGRGPSDHAEREEDMIQHSGKY